MGVEIIAPVAFFLTIFGIIYVLVTARNRERLALIDKGASAEIFNIGKKRLNFIILRLGMLLIGVATGLLIGNLLANYTLMREGVAYTSMIFLFGGLLLIINFILEKNMNKHQEA